MKTLKRIFRSGVSLAVALTMCGSAAAFSDVTEGDWYKPAVEQCEERGLLEGIPLEETFEPRLPVSRAMFCSMLIRYAQPEPEEETEPTETQEPFTDVPEESWCFDAISWAAENGLLNGYGDGTFRPDANISRQEMMTVMMRAASYMKMDITLVSSRRMDKARDRKSVPGWSESGVCWAMSSNLVKGYEDHTIRPTGTATRAEAAQILCNFMNWVECEHRFACVDPSTGAEMTCVQDGYGGDVVCADCGTYIKPGTVTHCPGFHDLGEKHLDARHDNAHNGHLEYAFCKVCGEKVTLGWNKSRDCAGCYDVLQLVTSAYRGDFTQAYAEKNDYSKEVKEAWVNKKGYTSQTNTLIWVNLAYQHVNIFQKQGGKWVLTKTILCASGDPDTPTPLGTYTILWHQDQWLDPDWDAHHITWFDEDGYAFHSILYYHGTMEVEDGRLGVPVSHGCVRLAIEEAKWIHDTIPSKTKVVIY